MQLPSLPQMQDLSPDGVDASEGLKPKQVR